MTDRSINMKDFEVRALWREIKQPGAGKTQHRMPLKLPAERVRPDMGGWAPTTVGGPGCYYRDGTPAPEKVAIWNQTTGTWIATPYQPGDRVWLRETWRCNGWATDVATIFYRASEGGGYSKMCEQFPIAAKDRISVSMNWRPSIHMPRWASRIWLEVTEVRVQRLQEISEADAMAEGVTMDWTLGQARAEGALTADNFGTLPDDTPLYVVPDKRSPNDDSDEILTTSPRKAFAGLWNVLHGPGSWDANPWVAATAFVPHLGNIDAAAPRAQEAVS